VALPTEIDTANADSVRDLLCAAAASGVAVVVADLTPTQCCDPPGFGAIMAARKTLPAAGVQLWLAVPPGNVRRVMQILGLDKEVVTHPTVAAAVARNSRPPHRQPGR
jgi:anti-anti-sigma factor